MKKLSQGFTLIEVIVSLTIFAIIASITSYVLFQSFGTDKQLKAQSTRLQQLELAITRLRRDTSQLINRPVRGDQQTVISAFVGQTHYVEFTRSGFINPEAREQRSTLKRIAYVCQAGALIRRSWSLLDTPNRRNYHDLVLLNHLQNCTFSYTNSKHQSISTWSIPSNTDHKKPILHPLPTSIICALTLVDWGPVVINLPLLTGFYE